MRTAPESSSYRAPGSLRSRGVAAALALALVILLILALLKLGALPDRAAIKESILATFDVRPQAPVASRARQSAARARPTPRKVTPPPPAPVRPPLPPTPVPVPGMIILSREEFAASDIGKLPAGRPTAARARPRPATAAPPTARATARAGSGSTAPNGIASRRVRNSPLTSRPAARRPAGA